MSEEGNFTRSRSGGGIFSMWFSQNCGLHILSGFSSSVPLRGKLRTTSVTEDNSEQQIEKYLAAFNGSVLIVPSFFQQSVERVDRLSSLGLNNTSANQALMTLAEYRSALQKSPTFPPSGWRLVSLPLTATEIEQQFREQGLTILRAANPDVQFFVPPENGRTFTIKNIVFIGGKQKLDGLTLIGVTFVETKIYYDGVYPVSLDRTSFVNCTFNMPSGPQSIPFLKYVALAKNEKLQLPSQ